jgi:hypothetical protein
MEIWPQSNQELTGIIVLTLNFSFSFPFMILVWALIAQNSISCCGATEGSKGLKRTFGVIS